MIDHSDFVITYIEHDFGGAAKFANRARKKNKNVIKTTPHKLRRTPCLNLFPSCCTKIP